MSARGQIVGYIRVSTTDQNIDRQNEQIKADRVFIDRVSGKDLERAELLAMLDYVREGDTIIVASMDRLARNVDDLRRVVAEQTKRGVGVRFLKENLSFSGDDSPMANMLLSVLGAVAQFERDLIRERQREGIEIAKKNGKFRGRKKALSDEQILGAQRRIAAGEKKSAVARAFGISRDTLYRSLDSTYRKNFLLVAPWALSHWHDDDFARSGPTTKSVFGSSATSTFVLVVVASTHRLALKVAWLLGCFWVRRLSR